MKLQNLMENQEKKLGDLEIGGEIVAPNGIRRNKWNGDLCCQDNQLMSLKGAPQHVDGDFWCNRNQLTSLEGAPEHIVGDFCCQDNQLVSLKGVPQHVGGDFWCNRNQLTSLEGSPLQIGGDFCCQDNQLVSLKWAPQHVDGDFWCNRNQLTSLEGSPKHVGGNFLCYANKLTSLEGIHEQIVEINGEANFKQNPIKSHVLGLLLIKGLKSVKFDNKQLANVINKYLPLGDIMECQNELIDDGLEEFAQI